MEIDWIHRPSGPDSTDGTLNLCFNALDRHVVHGHADDLALRVNRLTAGSVELTYARLLEEVAAFGGVLRAFGVGPGARVLSRLDLGRDGLVVALAAARVGAVFVGSDPYAVEGPAAALEVCSADGGAVVRTGGQELAWDVLMRAGRTDPAPCAEVPADAAAYLLGERTFTVEQAATGEGADWPLDAIGTLLDGGLVMLSLP